MRLARVTTHDGQNGAAVQTDSQVAARDMRPLHEVARNTRAGHFVWPGGGRSINLTSIEILPSSKSLTAPIPAHAPTSLPFLPAPPALVCPLRISLSFSPFPPYFFFLPFLFFSPPRYRLLSRSFSLSLSLFDPTHISVSCLVPVFSPLVSLSIMFSRVLFLSCLSLSLLSSFLSFI